MTYPNPPAPPPPPAANMGSTNTMFVTELRLDLSYITTPAGIIRLTLILFNLIGFICIQSSAFWANSRGVYFNLVAQLGLWYSIIYLCLYVWHVVERFHDIRWLQLEVATDAVLLLLMLVAATVVVAFGSAPYSAAGFFGYLCMMLYGADAFMKMQRIRAGDLAQGCRVATKPPHQLTPPALP